jgi:phage terminase large subunit-like protein
MLDKSGQPRTRYYYVGLPRKNGKALALTTPIPTATGWTTMGDIEVGEVVFDERGRRCRVVATTEVLLDRPCYRVSFSDGSAIVADAGHEWYVEPRWGKPAILSTEQMAGRVRVGHRPAIREHRYRIPVAAALDCEDADLPIAPYTLGAWLGDGHTAAARITVADAEVLSAIAADGYAIGSPTRANTPAYGIGLARAGHEALQTTMRAEGLLGDKHIPTAYTRAGRSQRLALLQGLMDTDGHVTRRGQCEFTTTLPRLAADVLELVRSLGMKPTIREGRAMLAGRDCGPKWRIQFHANAQVFRIARKAERVDGRRARSASRHITAIEPVPSVPVRCIEVDSPSRLYLAGEAMVPTHNSTLGAALAIYALVAMGEDGAQVYSCAGDRKQASIVFDEAKRMVLAEPELASLIRVQRWHLEGPRNSVYRVLSADAQLQQGLNPSFVVFDEVHVQPDRDLWDAMVLGMGARARPMIVGITTAGWDRTSLAWDLFERGRRGEIGFWWSEPRDSKADWQDPAVWREANPALGDFLFEEALVEDAKVTPEASFRRYHLNQWTTTHDAWLPHGAWDAIADPARSFAPDAPFVAFLDGSWSNDSTGIVACTLDEPHLSVLGHWTPDEALGHVDMGDIEARTREVLAMPGCRGLAFDPARFQDFFARLEADGHRVIEWPTNSLARMVPACQEFYASVMERKLTHDGDPRLASHVANAVLKEDRHGPRIVKEAKSSFRKIDLAVCAVGAYAEARRLATTVNPEPMIAWA